MTGAATRPTAGAPRRPPARPTALSAIRTMAALTWLRLIRGRALWVGFVIALVPVFYAGAAPSSGLDGALRNELFAFELLVLSVLTPMFVSSSIGEDIEDRTATYLWSRPIPRWAVLAGKLAALVPFVTAIVLGSWAAASAIAWGQAPNGTSVLALTTATVSVALLATGIASLAPKYGMALTIVYMLFFDLPIGVLPANLREASISFQARSLFAPDASLGHGLIALAVISAVWGAIAAARVRRLEV